MTAPAQSISPSPAECQERTLLNALFTNSHSLPALANSLNLTLIDLLELIASPAIQSKLIALEQAAAHAIRVAASFHLSKVLDTLTDTLDSHSRDFKLLEQRTDPEAATARRHERVHIRRAATTILRLTRFAPAPPSSLSPRESRRFAGEGYSSYPPTTSSTSSSSSSGVSASSRLSLSSDPAHSHRRNAHPGAVVEVPRLNHAEPRTSHAFTPALNPPHAPATSPTPLTSISSISPICPISPPARRTHASSLLRRAGAPLAHGPAP